MMGTIAKIKENLWKHASAGEKEAFDKDVEDLRSLCQSEWWRVGWDFIPQSAEDIVKLFKDASVKIHHMWLDAIERGEIPAEDVSPGEAFAMCSRIVSEAIHHAPETKAMPLLLPEEDIKNIINDYSLINADIGANEASFQAFAKYYELLQEDDKLLDVCSLYDHFDNDIREVGRKMFGCD